MHYYAQFIVLYEFLFYIEIMLVNTRQNSNETTLFFYNVMYAIFHVENKEPVLTEEEFKTLVEIGAEEKVLKRKEKELIEGVLEFGDITAKEVMTPRTKMYSLDGSIPLNKALKSIADSPFSRVPIFNKKIDNVIGVVHLKDVIRYVYRKKTKLKLSKIAQKPYFIPETKIISDLFKDFQEQNIHMAIVVDEYGRVSGIVTLEDLLEEIVGEIIDESDINPELIMRIDNHTVVVHGDTEIDHINHFFGTMIPEGDHSITIGGLILQHLKKFPKKGAKLEVETIKIIVEEVSEKHILKVKLIKPRTK